MTAIASRNVQFNASIPLVSLKTAEYGLWLENTDNTAASDIGIGISFGANGDKVNSVSQNTKLATVNALIDACAPPNKSPALLAVCGSGTTSNTCSVFSTGAKPGVNFGGTSQTIRNGHAYINIAVNPMFANSSLVNCLKDNAGNSLQDALNNAEGVKRGSSVTSGATKLNSKKGIVLSAVIASACYILVAA